MPSITIQLPSSDHPDHPTSELHELEVALSKKDAELERMRGELASVKRALEETQRELQCLKEERTELCIGVIGAVDENVIGVNGLVDENVNLMEEEGFIGMDYPNRKDTQVVRTPKVSVLPTVGSPKVSVLRTLQKQTHELCRQRNALGETPVPCSRRGCGHGGTSNLRATPYPLGAGAPYYLRKAGKLAPQGGPSGKKPAFK